jgi:hypothetical protein
MQRCTVRIEIEYEEGRGILSRTSHARDDVGRVFASSQRTPEEDVPGDPVSNRERAMVHNWLLVLQLQKDGWKVETVGHSLGDFNMVRPVQNVPVTYGERLMPGCECGAARRGDFDRCRCD